MCNMLPPTRNENMLFYSPKAVKLVLLSDRTQDGPSQTSWPLDPMRARPMHQPLAPILALLGNLGSARVNLTLDSVTDATVSV